MSPMKRISPLKWCKKTTQEGTCRYPKRNRKSQQWFMMNTLPRTYLLDERSMRQALAGDEEDVWRDAMHSEVSALKQEVVGSSWSVQIMNV